MVAATAIVAAYTAIALLLLRRRGLPDPWLRVDVFAVVGLVFNALLAAQQLHSNQKLPDSKEVKDEAFGCTFDPGMAKLNSVLGAAELLIYLDYGRWQLMPVLVVPALQWIGVALCAFTLVWLVWVDTYFLRHFATAEESQQIMAHGPYRFVRHPRYLGLLLSRAAISLVFASIIGWVILIGWIVVVLRRIWLEERHLEHVFGRHYEVYSQNRARLLPGVY